MKFSVPLLFVSLFFLSYWVFSSKGIGFAFSFSFSLAVFHFLLSPYFSLFLSRLLCLSFNLFFLLSLSFLPPPIFPNKTFFYLCLHMQIQMRAESGCPRRWGDLAVGDDVSLLCSSEFARMLYFRVLKDFFKPHLLYFIV